MIHVQDVQGVGLYRRIRGSDCEKMLLSHNIICYPYFDLLPGCSLFAQVLGKLSLSSSHIRRGIDYSAGMLTKTCLDIGYAGGVDLCGLVDSKRMERTPAQQERYACLVCRYKGELFKDINHFIIILYVDQSFDFHLYVDQFREEAYALCQNSNHYRK
ncbi:hypothetical protein PHYBLDRAFT_173429 [Phycomyces blakesleeanus NRRL 1555(-)]|uniref:Uncharacterized protein n=1 Tax=Phycomyces blakesleeanus (strain ATCC 8743b / DSM 1359 / FGSC 10004 / NBRC 33097 / NRRL 1555) TaxID=763407 RepID=A0A162TMV4_PHYB8|nr:hypothetical protein PHYBLDRAFT_173429 [Phycomyces blakesleeanus NRRL 1555(-)]OAD68433.1 hypothetical protein PHYBLDRAFT_173429 [Phycomyces blakesleeanus NRRL 1555(-)]|eukprot:XP_018286473.1 hypothetical protein PHYBLDRAFT_173429 [Phycomyces blakesleeanus NRRL 1555(-)]